MKIALVASEATPLIKTGGLADVIGSLSQEFVKQKHDVRVFLPLFSAIKNRYADQLKHIGFFYTLGQYAGIEMMKLNRVTYIFIDNEALFQRDSIYGYQDDVYRYAWFSHAVLDTFGYLDFIPDVAHVHDWHTAVLPYILKHKHQADWRYHKVKTLLTIHNIRFQGWASEDLIDALELPRSGDYMHKGTVNCLKCGIQVAHKINTVSPTYRNETLSSEFGEGLENILWSREQDYTGILNGIDLNYFSPNKSPMIDIHYTKKDVKEGKRKNKEALYECYKINQTISDPLIVMVTRITDQKGFDIVNQMLTELLTNQVQVFILGSGDHFYTDYLHELHVHYQNFFFYEGYNEALAHHLYAAADIFLMPSKFEPCGLAQMISLAFGTIPIVYETGGLKDSIIPWNQYEHTGFGFSFSQFNKDQLNWVICYALDVYRSGMFPQLIKNGFKEDFSSKRCALSYLELYLSMVV